MTAIPFAPARSALLRHPEWLIIIILALAFACTVRIEQHRLRTQRGAAAMLMIRATNVAAERDSTRQVANTNRAAARVLGDSLHAVEKHVLQIAQRRDALDKALTGERRARYALAASVDSLEHSLAAPADGDSTRRHATFALRQPPYTVAASVDIPDRGDSARLDLHVSLDPIPITTRLLCSATATNGVRRAALVASAPPWVRLELGRLEQSPDVCSPAVVNHTPARVRFARLLLGLGRVGTSNGPSGWGWFAGTGIAIGT